MADKASMSGPTSLETAAGSALFAANAVGIAIWDKNRQITAANTTFERELGVVGGSLGLSLEAIVPAEVCGNFATLLDEAAQSEGSLVLELPCLRGQTKVPYLVVVAGCRALDEGGICIFIDTKSRGAWVAHEINNSLAYAMGNLSFAIETLEAIESPTPQLAVVLLALRDALEGAERVRRTTRDLKALSRSSLPADEAMASVDGAVAKSSRRAQVLVIDDEPQMGTAIARILAPLHDVTTALSAPDAVARITKGESFDVILCDLMMPNMKGLDLYRALAETAPAAASRIVFMTGGPYSPQGAAFLDSVPNARLEKPFLPAALREIVRRALTP
jgi:CheY-like chemotaxis protein